MACGTAISKAQLSLRGFALWRCSFLTFSSSPSPFVLPHLWVLISACNGPGMRVMFFLRAFSPRQHISDGIETLENI